MKTTLTLFNTPDRPIQEALTDKNINLALDIFSNARKQGLIVSSLSYILLIAELARDVIPNRLLILHYFNDLYNEMHEINHPVLFEFLFLALSKHSDQINNNCALQVFNVAKEHKINLTQATYLYALRAFANTDTPNLQAMYELYRKAEQQEGMLTSEMVLELIRGYAKTCSEKNQSSILFIFNFARKAEVYELTDAAFYSKALEHLYTIPEERLTPRVLETIETFKQREQTCTTPSII